MGQILSHPKTAKTTHTGLSTELAYAVSCMQGWRVSMEDAHTTELNLEEDESKSMALFGVFDGHGGEKAAIYTGENLPRILLEQQSFKEGQYEQAMKDSFLAMDVALTKDELLSKDPSGCAATSVLITKDQIICANAGDSRTVMSVKDGECKPLSFDHKPTNEGEKARIVAAGGFVDMGRVNGNLALSRGIGDFEFKNNTTLGPEDQAVTALPDVLIHERSADDEFIVLACDGIWDCLTSQQVVDFVRKYVVEGKKLEEICDLMMTTCLAPTSGGSGIGCDNMSVCIVAILQNGESLDDWYKRITQAVTPEQLKQYPTADQLSMDLYNIDIEQKVRETTEDDDDLDENDDDDEGKEGGARDANALLKQLLASATSSPDGNVVYLDPSNRHLLQSLGVVEVDDDEQEEEEDAENGEHKIELAEEEDEEEEKKQ